jgi:hypothetical protein
MAIVRVCKGRRTCPLTQNLSLALTSRATLYILLSHALATTLSSSGLSTGRIPSLYKRVKKSSHDVKPWCSLSLSH